MAIAGIAGALLCLLYPFAVLRAKPARPSQDDRGVALVVALLLLLVAGGAAAVDAKVDDSGGDQSTASMSTASLSTASQGSAARELSVSERDLASFSGIDQIHRGPLEQDLCLVRFYTRGELPGGEWWTTCELAARKLTTVGKARELLALKHDWGTYDEKARYTIPAGTSVFYLRGSVADQCEPRETDCPYPGGGVQYLFPGGLAPTGPGKRECADPSKAKDEATFGPCRPTGT